MELTDPAAWARAVFGGAELGDVRRTQRLVKFGAALAARTGESIPVACGKNAAEIEGAYRLARNDDVKPSAIADAGIAATLKTVRELAPEVLLAPEDSTVLSYEHDVDELGDVGGPSSSKTQGLWAHSTLLVNPQTTRTVGLIAQHRWVREPERRGKRHQRKKRPYEEKESFKWQRTAEEMRARLGPELMNRVVAICDREGDIYAYLANKSTHGERFIVRAERDRRVAEEEVTSRLFELVRTAPVCGHTKVELMQRGGRRARTATLTLTASRVELLKPRELGADLPARIGVNAVLAEELNPTKGEEPLSWLLLTTEPIATGTDVERVLEWYRLRWRVEEFHKAWKTGAGVERQRMHTAKNLERIAVVLAFVAIRLLQLRESLDVAEDISCEQILPAETWKLLWVSVEQKKPPRHAPTAKWACRALARMAGWTDTKRIGRPSWATLWKGWSYFQQIYEGAQALNRLRDYGGADF